MRRCIISLVAASLILPALIGCDKVSNQLTNTSAVSTYQSIVKELSASKLKGRLTGTKGNEMTEELLAKKFQEIGLDPYTDDSYSIPYSHTMTENQDIRFEALLQDGSSKTFKYGEDFLEQQTNLVFDEKAVLTMDGQKLTADSAFLSGSGQDLAKGLQGEGKFVLLRSDLFKRYLPSASNRKPILQISPSTYDYLQDHSGDIDRIALRMKYTEKQVTASNVVGVIRGTSSKGEDPHVIYISAHFDALGTVGKQEYKGAGDNATGVSALLHLANSLKSYSKNKPLYSDIVFCAFNGEESDRQGSKAFASSLPAGVHSYMINMDTIGIKGGNLLLIRDPSAEALAQSLGDYLQGHSLKSEFADDYNSDHVSFSEKQIPALTVGKSEVSFIHTAADLEDTIDYDELSATTTALFNYILEQDQAEQNAPDHGHMDPASETDQPLASFSSGEMMEDQALIDQAKEKLKFKEYELISNQSRNFVVYQNTKRFESLNELQGEVPDYALPSELEGYSFLSADVTIDMSEIHKESTSLKLNQVYEWNKALAKRDISDLKLTYCKKDSSCVNITVSKTPTASVEDMNGNKVVAQTYKVNQQDFSVLEIYEGNKVVQTQFEKEGIIHYAQVFKGPYDKTRQDVGLVWKEDDDNRYTEFASRIPWKSLL